MSASSSYEHNPQRQGGTKLVLLVTHPRPQARDRWPRSEAAEATCAVDTRRRYSGLSPGTLSTQPHLNGTCVVFFDSAWNTSPSADRLLCGERGPRQPPHPCSADRLSRPDYGTQGTNDAVRYFGY
jgi:hypothetical protein